MLTSLGMYVEDTVVIIREFHSGGVLKHTNRGVATPRIPCT